MRKETIFRWVTAAGLAVGLAACERETQVPTDPRSRTVSSADPAALTNPDVPTFHVEAAGTTSGGPCVYSESAGQFECPDVTRNGITFTRRFTLYDANGNVQSKFDPATTASIKVETSAKGTATKPDGGSVTIDRSGVMVTSGLAGAETSRTLNGTEHGTVASEFSGRDGVKIQNNTVVDDTTSSLVIPVSSEPRTADRKRVYPLSGSRVHVTVTTSTRGTETHTFTVRRKETFDGTSVVQVEITANGETRTCTIDLAAHTSTCGR